MTGVWLTGKCSSDSKEHTQLISAVMFATTLYSHYKISQFYWRKYSVGVWLPVHRWIFYRRLHRRNTSVGFLFIGNSTFHRYIDRKHKKTICRWFYRRNLSAKKKVSRLKYTDGFYSVDDIVIYRRPCTIGSFVGECLKYRPNISVCKFVSNCGSYCQMPTD